MSNGTRVKSGPVFEEDHNATCDVPRCGKVGKYKAIWNDGKPIKWVCSNCKKNLEGKSWQEVRALFGNKPPQI